MRHEGCVDQGRLLVTSPSPTLDVRNAVRRSQRRSISRTASSARLTQLVVANESWEELIKHVIAEFGQVDAVCSPFPSQFTSRLPFFSFWSPAS